MSENLDLPGLPGYASIKESAKILGVAERTVYEYVEEGRLPGFRAANVIMISREDLRKFKRNAAGRPRKVTPPWRISSGENRQFVLLIHVSVKPGQLDILKRNLEEIRKESRHLFSGTVVRSVIKSESHPEWIVISLTWRGTVMPSEGEREQDLEAFRQELADVLDWETAQYDQGISLIHT
jgi:excisionase family DNA binding protein